MKNQKGFTLIELAIVLVIIGIILGAVIKGQDLIQNARAKKVVAKVKEWEMAQWTFFDRKGRFAGDSDEDGKIGDGDVKTDLINAKFINPPYEGAAGSEVNSITIGSYTFYVYFGTDGGNDTGKNIMIICKNAACNSAFDSNELMYIEAIDTAIDGTANGSTGNVICVSGGGTPDSVNSTTWVAYYNSAPTAAACTAGTSNSLVYYFDSKR